MSVIVRRVNGQKYKIEFDVDEILELTVFEVKGMIEVHWPDLETDFQKLIHKGKILEDEQTLKDCGNIKKNRKYSCFVCLVFFQVFLTEIG